MADEAKSEDQVTQIAEKVATVLKDRIAETPRSEKIKIGLQVAQFLVVSIVGTLLSFYVERIKAQQEDHNAAVTRQFKELETKALQAKVIQDFMNALVDASDHKRPVIALRAIEMFVSKDFALDVGKVINSDAAVERLDQIQAQVQPVAPAVAAPPEKQGWVYLGSYRVTGGGAAAWETRYFDFPKDKSPADIEKEKIKIRVLGTAKAANLRSLPPTSDGRLTANTVIRQVSPSDTMKVVDVEPVPNTSFHWAKVELN